MNDHRKGWKMALRTFLAVVLVLCSHMALARTLDVNLSSDTAEFRFGVNPSAQGRLGNSELDLGVIFTTDDDVLGVLGLQVIGDTGSRSPGLKAGVGVRLFGGSTDRGNDFLVISLGGSLRYNPPFLDRLDLRAYINYAPKIVSFMDADNFSYYGVRAGYEIMQEALVYVGYRRIELGPAKGSDETIDSGMNIGVEFYF